MNRLNRVPMWIRVALLLLVSSPSLGATPKEWTLLVYINGNNSLDSYGAVNIKQMETVGSTDSLNMVVQWASLASGDTKRMLVQKSTDASSVTSPVVQQMGQVDMGDYNTLVDFVKWGAANYPAKHYFVDIWNHGNGWHRSATSNVREISFDDASGNVITTPQLGVAMAQMAQIIGHPVDILGTDACLMAMLEVAAEVSDSVGVLVASEQTEPGLGWPYDTIASRWAAMAGPSALDVGRIVSEEYLKLYLSGSNASEVTMSAVDLSKLSALNAAIAALGKSLTAVAAADRAKVTQALSQSVSFAVSDYVNLSDFVAELGSLGIPGIRAETLGAVTQALRDYTIESEVTSSFSKAGGTSIWLPSSQGIYDQYSSVYQTLKFEKATGWAEALQWMLFGM